MIDLPTALAIGFSVAILAPMALALYWLWETRDHD